MSEDTGIALTQRAYTLRLRPAITKSDSSAAIRQKTRELQAALCATHEAVNRGAKVFGEWLLTLRGGLDHGLADEKIKIKRGNNEAERDPTPEERRNRRILLALSWLSVEDERGAPEDSHLIVASGDHCSKQRDNRDARDRKVVEALRNILKARGVPEDQIGDRSLEGTWLGDCERSLSSAIREDAVWVNRSAVFDRVTQQWNATAEARSDARTLLSFLLGDDFLTIPASLTLETSAETDADDVANRRETIAASSKGAGQKTRHPFSHLFGAGKPFGKPTRVLALRDKWNECLKPLIGSTGLPLLPVGQALPQADCASHTELQREMFSKAASRVAQIVTKQRQQEKDRQDNKAADQALVVMEMDAQYAEALNALVQYCREYRAESAATDEFRIASRQIAAWEQIIKAWASIKEQDGVEARKQAVIESQATNEDKKFGDVNLFLRFASEEYRVIWWHNGKADPSILQRFVAGMKARSDAVTLKVAAYRHPDPYANPIFCQFGVSRPAIRFRRLRAFTHEREGDDPRVMGMLLWHPQPGCAKLTAMYGVSRRLDREIGSASDAAEQGASHLPEVSRRGRLGTAAVNLPGTASRVRVASVFDAQPIKKRGAGQTEHDEELKKPAWNGTLSANRHALHAIRELLDKGDSEKAERHRLLLRWTVTVSMELKRLGPWFRYVEQATDKGPFLRTVRKDKLIDKNDPSKGVAARRGERYVDAEGWPWHEFNKPLKESNDGSGLVEDSKRARGKNASLVLCRLPGLRVLSVDLGHRFAAACAVWEALSPAQFKNETAESVIVAGGKERSDLYLHVATPTEKIAKNGRNKGKPLTENTVYRRIGPDELADGAAHPAPWARLDRQFLIKLQGEDRATRPASNAERNAVRQWEENFGRVRVENDVLPKRVDELMWSAVRLLRLALRRHGDRARVAFAMAADYKPMPGARKYHFFRNEDGFQDTLDLRKKKHVEFIQDALLLWYDLFSSGSWKDEPAKSLWDQHVVRLAGYEAPEEIAEEVLGAERKKKRQENRNRLSTAAEALAKDSELRQHLNECWKKRWETDDGSAAEVEKNTARKIHDATGWHACLRWIQDWVMPSARTDLKEIRGVGGLSLTRLATATELRRKVQVGFLTRLRPNGERTELSEGFGQRTLDALDRMREQRVKQLASRIVEAALGVGRMKSLPGRDRKRPKSRVDDPCHAVVIESLRNYRPDELQTRRENRALMNWSSGKVRKYLEEACQLHGLHLREVPANYTSRQCSRTGLPGVRCEDVPVREFLNSPWWNKRVKAAQKKTANGATDAESRLLVDLYEKWRSTPEFESRHDGDRKPLKTARVLRSGGGLFVAATPPTNRADGHPPWPLRSAVSGIQADLNAAANIGLRALLDPDFSAKWWYVPCNSKDGKPAGDKVIGAACVNSSWKLLEISERRAAKRDYVNAWRDLSGSGLDGHGWSETKKYWNSVLRRVVRGLRGYNGLGTDELTTTEEVLQP